jgi:hypothetical protein
MSSKTVEITTDRHLRDMIDERSVGKKLQKKAKLSDGTRLVASPRFSIARDDRINFCEAHRSPALVFPAGNAGSTKKNEVCNMWLTTDWLETL